MFHLPKQVIRPNKKSPIKDLLHHTDGKKRPDINQIKEEIEAILKRNNSPLFLKPNLQTQKSQKYLNLQTLQRKKSKIFAKPPQQYIEMAKNNRKLYQQFLLGGDIVLNKQKSITTIKQNLQTITSKSTSYEKDPCLDFITSKTNLNSHRTISHDQRSKKSKSMFHNEQRSLGLGKLLFSTDNEIKFRRTNLMSGKKRSQQKSIFKEAANQTFYQGTNFDLTKYLKSERKSSIQVTSKQSQIESTKQKSFEIVRKQIIPKQVSIYDDDMHYKNSQLPRIQVKPKLNQSLKQKTVTKSQKDSQKNPQQNSQIINKTLNVIDDQLLVYYGKLKNRKFLKHKEIEVSKKPTIHKIRPKEQKLQSKQFKKVQDVGLRTSRQLKKQHQIQSSWKTNRLDPWDKIKIDSQAGQDNLFGKLQDNTYLQEQLLTNF